MQWLIFTRRTASAKYSRRKQRDMTSVFFGLIAAFAWGLHDLLVRLISRSIPIPAALSVVLLVGTFACLPVALASDGWGRIDGRVAALCVLAGGSYVIGCLGLYRAFSEGPVKLVAPIIGAYPVLSVGWAMIAGNPVTLGDWLAVATIITGIGVVASLADPGEPGGRRKRAILYAGISAAGFAATFALGQAAVRLAGDWPVVLVIRFSALVPVLALALRQRARLPLARLPVLSAMGLLDAAALGMVTIAGALPRPEFAAVTTSIFGIVTILLARLFLKEPVSLPQWAGIMLVFVGVASLGT